MKQHELRFTLGELEMILAALDAMPFEVRCATRTNYYLLKNKLEFERHLLK